jgi:hypothetical protein
MFEDCDSLREWERMVTLLLSATDAGPILEVVRAVLDNCAIRSFAASFLRIYDSLCDNAENMLVEDGTLSLTLYLSTL